jgi:hypothetical protein
MGEIHPACVMLVPVDLSYATAADGCEEPPVVFKAVANKETDGDVVPFNDSCLKLTDSSLSLDMISHVGLTSSTKLITCIPGISDLFPRVAGMVELGKTSSDVCPHTALTFSKVL